MIQKKIKLPFESLIFLASLRLFCIFKTDIIFPWSLIVIKKEYNNRNRLTNHRSKLACDTLIFLNNRFHRLTLRLELLHLNVWPHLISKLSILIKPNKKYYISAVWKPYHIQRQNFRILEKEKTIYVCILVVSK